MAQKTYQLVVNLRDYVGVVHSASMVGPDGPDVHAGLVVPVRQEVVQSIVGHGLRWNSGALPGTAISGHTF